MLNRQIFLKLYLPLSLVLLVLLVFEGSKNEASKNIDDFLQEVNDNFELNGININPGLIAEFSNWISDGTRPHTVSVDVLAASDTNEYSKERLLVDKGRINFDSDGSSYFSYKWLGKLKNGIHVLETWEGGGGSGVFMALFFVKFEIGSGFNSDGTYKRLLMTIMGSYILGDRSSSEITVINDQNKVFIGPDYPGGTHVYRDKAVILEFDANKNMIMTVGGKMPPMEIKTEKSRPSSKAHQEPKSDKSVSADDFQEGQEAYSRGDYKTAFEKWKPLAEQGDAEAQYELGAMYSSGRGIPQDEKESENEAIKWWRLAAEQGGAKAQFALAEEYRYGDGNLRDYVFAHMWYNLAGANGEKDAIVRGEVLEDEMSPLQIKKAQEMAKEWKFKTWQEILASNDFPELNLTSKAHQEANSDKSVSSLSEEWEHKDWATNYNPDTGRVHFLSHGSVVYGHQFGFIKKQGNCNTDILWISWSPTGQTVNNFGGREIVLKIDVDGTSFLTPIKLLARNKVFPGTMIMSFNNPSGDSKFMDLIKMGKKVKVTIVGPANFKEHLDILSDSFSLNGFVANQLKAKEICEKQAVRNIENQNVADEKQNESLRNSGFKESFGVSREKIELLLNDFKKAVREKDAERFISHLDLEPDVGYEGPTPEQIRLDFDYAIPPEYQKMILDLNLESTFLSWRGLFFDCGEGFNTLPGGDFCLRAWPECKDGNCISLGLFAFYTSSGSRVKEEKLKWEKTLTTLPKYNYLKGIDFKNISLDELPYICDFRGIYNADGWQACDDFRRDNKLSFLDYLKADYQIFWEGIIIGGGQKYKTLQGIKNSGSDKKEGFGDCRFSQGKFERQLYHDEANNNIVCDQQLSSTIPRFLINPPNFSKHIQYGDINGDGYMDVTFRFSEICGFGCGSGSGGGGEIILTKKTKDGRLERLILD